MRQRSLSSRNTPTYPSTVPVSIRCDIDGIVAANPTNFHVMYVLRWQEHGSKQRLQVLTQ